MTIRNPIIHRREWLLKWGPLCLDVCLQSPADFGVALCTMIRSTGFFVGIAWDDEVPFTLYPNVTRIVREEVVGTWISWCGVCLGIFRPPEDLEAEK